MQKFTAAGREWQIVLTFSEVKRIKQASNDKFNLLDTLELPKLLQEDLLEFWELLWCVVEPQATAANINAEQFGLGLADEVLVEAQQKFFLEWAAFFRKLRREEVAIALEKMASYTKQAVELVKAKFSGNNLTEMDNAVTEKMQRELNDGFGKLLASLAE